MGLFDRLRGRQRPPSADAAGDDPVVAVAADDAEMEAAIDAAKQSLGEFLTAFMNPQPGQTSFLLKAVFVKGSQSEHLWLADLNLSSAAKMIGVVANEPQLPGFRFKQRVTFTPPQITDWMYVDDGRLVGGFTTRVLRNRIPADQLEAFDAASPYTF